MHPLPRNAEVGEEVDDDQRAAYFRQVSFLHDWRLNLCVMLTVSFADAIRSLL